jgi:predicted phage terminase large subunit-like protein
VICVDDPHNTQTEMTIESDSDRNAVKAWAAELFSTRLNSPKESVIAVTMQRLHQSDLSGVILAAMDDDDEEWVHLCIPNEFDTRRRHYTIVLPQWGEEPWTDPRERDGELMWPERLGPEETKKNKRQLGLYMYAGRYQQLPVPKGGGIIKDDWWQTWDNQTAMRYGRIWKKERMEFPTMELVVGSIDTAMTEKDENNFSAMTVWGIWLDYMGNKRVMLMYAWAKRLGLHEPLTVRMPGETSAEFKIRKRDNMGLVERVAATCTRYHVQRLLIEDKTRGPDLAAELIRLYSREKWGIEKVPVARDKVSRTHSIVPLFTDGMIWAPDTTWAEAVITNCSLFPKGEHDDLHDTVTQFLNWARVSGILLRVEEAEAEREDEMRWHPKEDTVAELYNVG